MNIHRTTKNVFCLAALLVALALACQMGEPMPLAHIPSPPATAAAGMMPTQALPLDLTAQPMDVFVLQEEGVLAPGEQVTWMFKTQAVEAVWLWLEARVDWHRLAGATMALEIRVNDVPLEAGRLINKSLTYTLADGRSNTYCCRPAADTSVAWVLFYSPNFADNDLPGSGYQVLEGQSYRYVFDITGLATTGQANTITLVSWTQAASKKLEKTVRVIYRGVRVLAR